MQILNFLQILFLFLCAVFLSLACFNLRRGPGNNHKSVGKAYMENTFEILDQGSGWLRVRLENGEEEWVSKKTRSEGSKILSSQSSPVLSYDSSKTKFSRKRHDPM